VVSVWQSAKRWTHGPEKGKGDRGCIHRQNSHEKKEAKRNEAKIREGTKGKSVTGRKTVRKEEAGTTRKERKTNLEKRRVQKGGGK